MSLPTRACGENDFFIGFDFFESAQHRICLCFIVCFHGVISFSHMLLISTSHLGSLRRQHFYVRSFAVGVQNLDLLQDGFPNPFIEGKLATASPTINLTPTKFQSISLMKLM
jgi:hypothetical protein